MAVGIMSASLLLLCLLHCFLQVFSQGGLVGLSWIVFVLKQMNGNNLYTHALVPSVFQSAPGAHAVFLRSKRANMFLLEEILEGNLERECYEELCNFEEAREYFEDTKKTIAFWADYTEGNQCRHSPCLNGGNCTGKVGGFTCSCSAPYYGSVCELKAPEERLQRIKSSSAALTNAAEMPKCPTEGPTACHQLCTVTYGSFRCSCTSGFKLDSDRRSCLPEVKFPCGRLPDRTVSTCHRGNCPWQVSVLNSTLQKVCSGVVLGRRAILTTARCLYLDSEPNPSNVYVLAGNKRMLFQVKALYIHNHFHTDHHDHNLALLELADSMTFSPTLIHLCLPTKDFCENILMHSGRAGITVTQEGSKNQNMVYMTLDECRREMNISHPLSNKMFCMRKQNEPSGNQNETHESPGTQRNPNVHLKIPNRAHRRQNRPLGNQTRVHGRPHGHTVNRIQNQTRNTQNGAPNRAASHNTTSKALNLESSHGNKSRLEASKGPCDGLMPGSPVATVEQGTAFLTGLLISSPSDCQASGGGLVFSKVSRYLSWIQVKLELTEQPVNSQIIQYPEDR